MLDDDFQGIETALGGVYQLALGGWRRSSAMTRRRRSLHAMEHDLTLKAAALQLGFVSEADFDRVVDPRRMVHPYVATENRAG